MAAISPGIVRGISHMRTPERPRPTLRRAENQAVPHKLSIENTPTSGVAKPTRDPCPRTVSEGTNLQDHRRFNDPTSTVDSIDGRWSRISPALAPRPGVALFEPAWIPLASTPKRTPNHTHSRFRIGAHRRPGVRAGSSRWSDAPGAAPGSSTTGSERSPSARRVRGNTDRVRVDPARRSRVTRKTPRNSRRHSRISAWMSPDRGVVYDACARSILPFRNFLGPAALGRMSKAKISVGT